MDERNRAGDRPADAGPDRGGHPTCAADPAWRGRPRAAHRVRERRQPAARAFRRTSEGSRPSRRDRRQARRHHPPTPGREPAAGGIGRGPGTDCGSGRSTGAPCAQPGRSAARQRARPGAAHRRDSRLASARLHAAVVAGHRVALRPGARAAPCPHRSRGDPQGRWRPRLERHARRADAWRARRRGDRARAGTARRRDAPHPNVRRPSPGATRLRSAERAHAADFARRHASTHRLGRWTD